MVHLSLYAESPGKIIQYISYTYNSKLNFLFDNESNAMLIVYFYCTTDEVVHPQGVEYAIL